MSQQDPLKKSRLGLRGILLACGGVLVASSVFFIPNIGDVGDSTPTTALAQPRTTAAPSDGATVPEGAAESSIRSQGAAAGPTEESGTLLPVYWLGEVGDSERLFREYLPAPQGAAREPISDAVQLMTAGQPLDPDYHSPWRPASRVTSSISTKNVITVDISSDAVSEQLEEADARLALQQLVYTATAAASNAGLITGGEASSVVVLIDGAAQYRAFGAVDIGGEWTRDPATLAPVWIIDPQEGVEADAGSVTVHGVAPDAAEFVSWQIDRSANGSTEGGSDLFRDGRASVSAGEGGQSTYSFSVTLPPGRYGITVSVVAEDGAAQDTKSVVVR